MIPNNTQYCLGFLFDFKLEQVALINKAKPAWQKGKLNGIGGHIEAEESPVDAMVREFKEETTLYLPTWDSVGRITGIDWEVIVFTSRYPSLNEPKLVGTGSEPVQWYEVASLPRHVIPNIRWVVPFCREVHLRGKVSYFDVRD